MRVLMLTQALDETDWLVGFIPPWVNQLARQVEALDVLALRVGAYTPPPNVRVYSMGKERGWGRLRLGCGFYRAVVPLIRQADVVFVHMIPRYAIMAAPLAHLLGKPMTLWYVHRRVDRELRLALALCRRVATAAPHSFPLPTPKLRVLGHGIDTDFFAPVDDDARRGDEGNVSSRPAIVHVARLMPIKHQATLLRALAHGVDAQAVLIGGVPRGQDAAYADSLKALANDLGIADRVSLIGGLPSPEVRHWYRRAAAAVNLTPPGSFDKAALESMAVGAPTVVGNPAFDSLLGEYAPRLRLDSPDDAAGLAERLRALLALSPEEHAVMTGAIRARVVAAHSLEQLMARLVSVLKAES